MNVTNAGTVDGEEVVQIYFSPVNRRNKMPLKALKGFSRIFLKAGEHQVVKFTLSPQDLSIVTESGTLREFKRKIVISAGGSQPDERNVMSGNILTRTLTIL
jgi:beta-glucosidase